MDVYEPRREPGTDSPHGLRRNQARRHTDLRLLPPSADSKFLLSPPPPQHTHTHGSPAAPVLMRQVMHRTQRKEKGSAAAEQRGVPGPPEQRQPPVLDLKWGRWAGGCGQCPGPVGSAGSVWQRLRLLASGGSCPLSNHPEVRTSFGDAVPGGDRRCQLPC